LATDMASFSFVMMPWFVLIVSWHQYVNFPYMLVSASPSSFTIACCFSSMAMIFTAGCVPFAKDNEADATVSRLKSANIVKDRWDELLTALTTDPWDEPLTALTTDP